MSLVIEATAQRVAQASLKFKDEMNGAGVDRGMIFLDILQTIIDEDFQKGITSLKNVDITTPAGTLDFKEGPVSEMARNIATGCYEYWSKTIEPTGSPEEDEIVSVSNDAEKIIEPIVTRLLAIGGNKSVSPSYIEFITVIYEEVMKIQWTVEELVSTFDVTIS